LAVRLPRAQHGGEDAVGQGGLQRVDDLDPLHEVGAVVGDALDPPGIEHLRLHQAHPLDPEVPGDADRARDVDDVLRVDEDEHDGRRRRHHASPRKETSWRRALSRPAKPALSTAFM
jgi:hypothetical protein